MAKIKDLLKAIDELAPFSLQESYDNAGLIVGNPANEVNSILVSFDVTEEVVEEAIHRKASVIVAHHPIVFKGLKRFTGANYVERTVIKAIQHNVAIIAVHTNLDNVLHGTNSILAEKLKLKQVKALAPVSQHLFKLVSFVPTDNAEQVRKALFDAGAGHIGNYDSCSFNTEGKGSFKGNDDTNPYVGEKNQVHFEDEIRIETIFPKHLQSQVISSLLQAHPYEEVAYDIYPLQNKYHKVGAGMIGILDHEQDVKEFLVQLKNILGAAAIKHTKFLNKKIKKVALCGGSGAFLINAAKSSGADIYVSGDIKYHEFFDAEDKLIIADVGHYESEQFTKELLISYISEKFPTFAVLKSEINTNPVNYL